MIKNNINYKNFFTSSQDFVLKTDADNGEFGHSKVEYTMLKRTDVTNLTKVPGYMLIVKQRITIPNQTQYVPGSSTITSYQNYPAIIENSINLEINNDAQVQLANIFPRTLNSNVTTNTSSQAGTTSSVAHQHTTGSSTSNVNTFGVGIMGGFFGELPMGSVSLNYSHSWVHDTSSSHTDSGGSSAEKMLSYSNSMSVKDWSSYSNLSNNNKSVRWVWGQSYPWDVILYNQTTSGDNVELPDFVNKRLRSGNLLLPPSELSLFGLDFTSHACWLIDFPNGISSDEIITITHKTANYTATHEKSGETISAKLQSKNEASMATYSSGKLDLSQYSLAPLQVNPSEGIPTIGFRVNEFVFAPVKNTDQFKILSPKNNLEVKGTGFDSVMTSLFKTNPTLKVSFKIEDNSFDYSLAIIHWLEKGSGDCTLSWKVNGQFTGITNLTHQENSESHQNMTQISLRNLDFRSLNFHDYLVIGLNHIEITIEPSDQKASHAYTLSSISIR